jgi:RNA polymerase sigma-70 factor, ECF subfamily
MQPEDKTLIGDFLRGDLGALKVIDGWIERAARPYARRLASQWEDVLQEIRLEVTQLLRQGAYRGESSFKTYLWRIVNHTCVDRIRTQDRWHWVELDELAEKPGPPNDSPLRHVLQNESRQVLLRVLEEVPEECRRLWAMILNGLSYQEMGRQLNVSEGSLRVRVLRCRKRAIAIRDQLFGRKKSASM